MHELDDERPIPLGRAAGATPPAAAGEPDARPDDAPSAPAAPPAAEPAPRPAEVAAPPVAATPPGPRPDAHIEKTRLETAPPPDEPAGARPDDATSPVTMPAAEVAIAVAEPASVLPAATVAPVPAPAAAADHAPDEHPLAGLRGVRFQLELVEPAVPVRDLGRFLVAYVIVAAFVLGLIVAFLALTQVGSKGA